MSNIVGTIQAVIMLQLFFAFSITTITFYMPADSLNYVGMFSDGTTSINLATVGDDVRDSLTRQTNIPVVDMGALIFYSGNLLIDLIMNFIMAIPEILTLLISGILYFLPIAAEVELTIKIFVTVTTMVFYLLGIIIFISQMRSGSAQIT